MLIALSLLPNEPQTTAKTFTSIKLEIMIHELVNLRKLLLSPLVVVSTAELVPLLRAVTFAFGLAAPPGSVMLPVIVARFNCANKKPQESMNTLKCRSIDLRPLLDCCLAVND